MPKYIVAIHHPDDYVPSTDHTAKHVGGFWILETTDMDGALA